MSVRDSYNNNTIKVKRGQLYCEACADILREYLTLSQEERKEMRETQRYKQAYANVNSFHRTQRNAIFGEDLIEKINHK